MGHIFLSEVTGYVPFQRLRETELLIDNDLSPLRVFAQKLIH